MNYPFLLNLKRKLTANNVTLFYFTGQKHFSEMTTMHNNSNLKNINRRRLLEEYTHN